MCWVFWPFCPPGRVAGPVLFLHLPHPFPNMLTKPHITPGTCCICNLCLVKCRCRSPTNKDPNSLAASHRVSLLDLLVTWLWLPRQDYQCKYNCQVLKDIPPDLEIGCTHIHVTLTVYSYHGNRELYQAMYNYMQSFNSQRRDSNVMAQRKQRLER